jgi:uncharacterized repeat protein (TIGR01451 family)
MKRSIAIVAAIVFVALAFVCLCWRATPVAAGPVAQVTLTPRPKLTVTPSVSTSAQRAAQPPHLTGTIFDWGKGNMPAGVRVVLRGDGWEIPVETDASGAYVFQNIGNEVGFLSAYVPEDRPDLETMASELPVRVEIGHELVVNLAFVPEGVEPDSLISLSAVSSSAEVGQGEKVSFVITVANDWDQGINQLVVADYLPEGLTYVSASTSQGSVEFDRGLVWAELGTMAPGDAATVTVMARVDKAIEPGTTINNEVAAYHSENAAVQAAAAIEIVKHSNGVLPVTGFTPMLPAAVILLAGLLLGARRFQKELP